MKTFDLFSECRMFSYCVVSTSVLLASSNVQIMSRVLGSIRVCLVLSINFLRIGYIRLLQFITLVFAFFLGQFL